MRRLFEPIAVEAAGRTPTRVRYGSRSYAVEEVIGCWVLESRWWNPARRERRVYYRLRTGGGALLDVYRSGHDWVLARILD